MTTLIARLWRRANLADELIALQKERIAELKAQNAELRDQRRLLILEQAREMQGMYASWLISLEKPEVDMREQLAESVTELGHAIASLEEHVI